MKLYEYSPLQRLMWDEITREFANKELEKDMLESIPYDCEYCIYLDSHIEDHNGHPEFVHNCKMRGHCKDDCPHWRDENDN